MTNNNSDSWRPFKIFYANADSEFDTVNADFLRQSAWNTHMKIELCSKGEEDMKIAITAEKPQIESPIDPRFGRAKVFMIYDDEKETWEFIDNTQNLQAAQGAGIQSAAHVVNAGCEVLISGHCGPKAFTALNKAGVSVYTVSDGTVKNAIDSFKQGILSKIESADVEGHW